MTPKTLASLHSIFNQLTRDLSILLVPSNLGCGGKMFTVAWADTLRGRLRDPNWESGLGSHSYWTGEAEWKGQKIIIDPLGENCCLAYEVDEDFNPTCRCSIWGKCPPAA